MNVADLRVRGAIPSPEDQQQATFEAALSTTDHDTSLPNGINDEHQSDILPSRPTTELHENLVDSTLSDLSISKKRKRAASPPWQFPTAEKTTLKTTDGRRASARVYASHSATPVLSENEGQARLSSRAASSRLSSPPWKEFKAEGPTSLQVDGVRKSGRVNKDLSTPKRVSPRSRKLVNKLAKDEVIRVGKRTSEREDVKSRPRTSSVLEEVSTRRGSDDLPKVDRRTKAWRDSQRQDEPPSSAELKHKRQFSLEQPAKLSPRIKLRVNAARNVIHPPHPHASFPEGLHPPQPSFWQILEEAELKEMQQPYSENEKGPPSREEFERRHRKVAEQEAAMRHRILDARKPGGALSEDTCSIYQDAEPQKQPDPQYGHVSHLVSQITFFRELQKKEALVHRQNAKKVALLCQEKWRQLRGPSLEDQEAAFKKMYTLVYKQVAADIRAKWELVQQFVQDKAKAKYEAEQEVRRQKKLAQQLAWSENMVARQRGEIDSDEDLDEDLDDDDDDDNDETETDSDENMSDDSSEDDVPEQNEEGMDDDALQAYLAQREVEPPDKQLSLAALLQDDLDSDIEMASMPVNAVAGEQADEVGAEDDSMQGAVIEAEQTSAALIEELDDEAADGLSSDESVDMDSEDYDSDEDMSDTDDASEGGQSASSEDLAPRSGLLGFFSKSDLRAQGLPTPVTSAEGDNEREHMKEQEHTGGPEVVDQDVPTTSIETPPEEVKPLAKTHLSTVHSSRPETPASQDSLAKQLVPQPALLRGTLRSYQHAGLDWLASLYRNGTNGILADEMGLGKTIQTISLFAHLAEEHNVWDPHLVIVPTSVVLNWVTEFQKFLPGFRVLGYYGSTEERHAKRRSWINDPHHEIKDKRGYNVIVTSYNIALKDINAIRNVQWHYMVLDEAHNIRNFNSQRFQNLIKLKTRARLLLTGTPLQNSLTELWSLLTFLTAGREQSEAAPGGLEEFLARWKEPVNEIFERGVLALSEEATKVVGQLHTSLRPFMLRRLKADVEKDLPKKTEHVVVCKLSKRQRQLYQDYMGLSDTRAKLTQGNAISAGKVLLSLRRVCNHPDLFDPRPIQTSYAMEKSPLDAYASKYAAIRRLLGLQSKPQIAMLTALEQESAYRKKQGFKLSGVNGLQYQITHIRTKMSVSTPDTSTIAGCQALLRVQRMQTQIRQLRAAIQYTESYYNNRPVYGVDIRELVTVRSTRKTMGCSVLGQMQITTTENTVAPAMLAKSEPCFDQIIAKTSVVQKSLLSIEQRAESLHETIIRFAFCTPEVTAPILPYAMDSRTQNVLRATDAYPLTSDPAHEARMRTSIVFPDSRLLVYDAGKLQRLTVLLRELQAKGSRSLIFTQMSGTLNVLEQFLSLMGLPYLRLDGSTPVERRALYSAEFNRPDSKYQCMILSSRAGGVGLNLTGASSVIFYDLDWNPQMDKQCMDRAHRIGQVRDVEVFKLVSEKTVEENILRRANQKSLLDQTVIQEGHFTTDYGRSRDSEGSDDDVAAAIDRFLSAGDKAITKTIESVEDKEDVQAAQQARKEELQDEEDFAERSSKGPSVPPTPGLPEGIDEQNLEGHIDSYMIETMEWMWQWTPYVPPKVTTRDRSHRKKRRR